MNTTDAPVYQGVRPRVESLLYLHKPSWKHCFGDSLTKHSLQAPAFLAGDSRGSFFAPGCERRPPATPAGLFSIMLCWKSLVDRASRECCCGRLWCSEILSTAWPIAPAILFAVRRGTWVRGSGQWVQMYRNLPPPIFVRSQEPFRALECSPYIGVLSRILKCSSYIGVLSDND